ncbi:DNA-binding protein REB1 [Stemphylium lycopersici]|nr:dna-binding protein [Stemphylium lycopersici]RAR02211.1 DNA-binding protein REB1 [Stemphylium lycopersici]
MVTSSPGYAIFKDLRDRMGISSSQPIPTSSRDANASTVASPTAERKSHFSPKEDDMAASQQLMDEGARANLTSRDDSTPLQPGGVDGKPASAQKRRKKQKVKPINISPMMSPATAQDTANENDVPASSPFPFPATQPETDESGRPPSSSLRMSQLVNGSSHPSAVEVPDSQIAATAADAPAPSPKSSHVVPSSATKNKRTYKKSRQAKRDQVAQNAVSGGVVDEPADTNIDVDEPASPSRTTSQRKRQRARDTEVTSLETAEVSSASDTAYPPGAAVNTTPVPAKRRKMGTPKSATMVHDLFQTSPNDDDNLQRVERTKLKRVKKPQTPIVKAKDIYDIPDDEPNTANGNGYLQESATRKKRSAKKSMKGAKVYDWPASVRKPGHPLGETPYNEDYIMQDPISSDDEVPPNPPRKRDQSEEEQVAKKKKKARPSEASVRKVRLSNGDGISLLSSAERALNMDRELGHPPDVRATGDFTDDEEELIRRAIKDFQQRRGLETSELVEIIQWNHHDPGFNREPGYQRNKSDWAPQDIEDARESAEFWEEIRNIGLIRKHDRLRRHIRQLYHQFKSGAWTEEEDQQLRNLQALHPNQWKLISITMGDRSTHDCVNRWRDYLQYGDSRKTSRWSEEEEQLLVRAVTTVAQRDEDFRAESGRPPLAEYTSKDISWPQVAHEMGDSRSRIQASVKWTKMMRRENPPQIQLEYKARVQTGEPTPKKRGRRSKGDAINGVSSEKRPKTQKSSKYCYDSDAEEEGEPEDEVEDQQEPIADDPATGKPRKSKTASSSPEDQESEGARVDEGPSDPPSKKKRGRPRKSETTEADTCEKRGKPSTTADEVADETGAQRPAEKQVEDRSSVSPLQKKKRKRSRKSETTENDNRGGKRHKSKKQDEDENEDARENDEGHGGQIEEDHVEEAQMLEEQEINAPTQEQDIDSAQNEPDPIEVVQDQSTVAPTTPPPDTPPKSEESVAPGVDQMLWGDKYDLIFKLQDRRDDYEEDIDWEDVAKEQSYPWSLETLQTALHQLIQLLRDNGREVDTEDFPGTVDDVMDLISEEHGAELEDHYTPS